MASKARISFAIISSVIIISLVIYTLNFFSRITNKVEGSFGQSESKQSAVNIGSYITDYFPSKDTIVLLDNRRIILGQAWAEKKWSYHNRKPRIEHDWGYNLHLEFSGRNEDFIFTMDLFDKSNEVFTNGIKQGVCIFSPEKLLDTIDIVVVERNPKEGVGWIDPISTDTISLIRIKMNESTRR